MAIIACDLCHKTAVLVTDDGGSVCERCKLENIIYCHDCDKSMIWSSTLYHGDDGKVRCKFCDEQYELNNM
jgi:hypothetical protein